MQFACGDILSSGSGRKRLWNRKAGFRTGCRQPFPNLIWKSSPSSYATMRLLPSGSLMGPVRPSN